VDIGQKIRRLRRARDITQAGLAKRAGMATNTVNRIEKGHMPRPSADSLAKIADALDIAIGELYEEEPLLAGKGSAPPDTGRHIRREVTDQAAATDDVKIRLEELRTGIRVLVRDARLHGVPREAVVEELEAARELVPA
jgi:transcriptional regulator with XRE-family HTH domain